MRKLSLGLALAGLALSFTLVTAPAAEACLNGVVMEESEAAQSVKLAEIAIDQGKNAKARRLLAADHYVIQSAALMKPVRVLKAVASLRLGKGRAAERVFRRLLKKDQDNPFLQARLAESLHKRKGDDAIEAWQIMDDLEKRDLVPDAHAFAVLARLRHRAKDQEGQERALAQCRLVAKTASEVCL